VRLPLDINVLVAILDKSHVHQATATALIEKPRVKIATCALTENGVLRTMNLTSYGEYGPASFEAITAVHCAQKSNLLLL
jgi:uncharacterized protein